ncbi:hypothetical protein [Belnapia rosea]|uniref:Glycosyl transferase family 8 n=1 Tax=Belnapia rosea TaxID=938405 RepID=A0A1G7DJ32_9PROT|nr:hypothetical protein [Belnapia rosea]SDE51070.1 hypothetical protein SAMN04487779_10468 [Belnapia rosea]
MPNNAEAPVIAVVANDPIAPELLRFLVSLRRYSKDLRVRIIPFNDDTALCRAIGAHFGCEWVEDDLSRYDLFGRELFDDDPPQQPYPYMLGKIRKLWIFDQPGPVAYIDIDTIVTSDIGQILRQAAEQEFDLSFASVSKGWIYEDVIEAAALLRRTNGFSSSFLFKRTNRLTFDAISGAIRKNLPHYQKVRRRGVVDQPLLNYAVDQLPVTVKPMYELVDISSDTVASRDLPWFKASIQADGRVLASGKPVLYLHAVGKYKHSREYDFLFKGHLVEGLFQIAKAKPELGQRVFEAIRQWIHFEAEE